MARTALFCVLATDEVASAQVTPSGEEFQVPTYTFSAQRFPAVGMDADGDFVVAWFSSDQDFGGIGIFAQRFNAQGSPVDTEFQVNSYVTGSQTSPAVAMNADGDFVVVWESDLQDGSGDGIFGRFFDAAGGITGEFRVNSYTPAYQRDPSVGIDGEGGFTVAWRSDQSGTEAIFARRFQAGGIAMGVDFQVAPDSPGEQSEPFLAMNGDGKFVVAWTSNVNTFDSFARQFGPDGEAIGGSFRTSLFTTGLQTTPSVGMKDDGDFVLTWTSDGEIVARRFSAAGPAVATEFQVNLVTSGSQLETRIAVDGDGDFVIAWTSSSLSGLTINARRFSEEGIGLGTELMVSELDFDRAHPSLGSSSGGDFVIAWESVGQDGSGSGVFARRFAVPGAFDLDGNGATDALTDGLLLLRYLFGFRGSTLVTGAVALDCSRCTAVPLEAYLGDLTSLSQAEPVGLEFQINAYTPTGQLDPELAIDGDGDFVLAWQSPHDGVGLGVFTRRFHSTGEPATPEVQANEYVTGNQFEPVVATDFDGDFVVVWRDDLGRDGDTSGVFARRFDSGGVALGVDFQANSFTVFGQRDPTVGMDGARNLVVAWRSENQDGSATGIFARRFDATGSAQASEFQVNQYTAGAQVSPAIAMNATGAFVVSWFSYGQDGSGTGVFARRFAADGAAQATEFQVNTFNADDQSYPATAMAASGDFVIVWHSYLQDGSAHGVFGRRFSATGTPQASEFRANSHTIDIQNRPDVSMSATGDFVVSWQSNGQDGSNYGIFARRFSAEGVPQAVEFQVNTNAAVDQRTSTTAFDGKGRFIVAWQSDYQDGSGQGIFAQRFAGSRDADVDGNGVVDPLGDGLLLLRYLFGFRGATLINGAVDPEGCTRCTAAAIESYIATKV